MLDFFFYNEISPRERLGPTGRTIDANLKKRINAVIAIMKDMEKTQTMPTVALLYTLFEQAEPPKKPMFVEKNRVEKKEVRFQERNTSNQNNDEQWKR